MATQATTSFAFQPWPRKDQEEAGLKEVLARVNFERGHFRDITEASLQEEIAAEGALELSESESEDDGEEDGASQPENKHKPTTREELWKAKMEMTAAVAAAQNDVWYALDFVSLLLSKDAPRQAQNTMSAVLKQSAPLGSIGMDMWKRMPLNKVREAQDELLATNVRMQGLQESADSLLAAAARFRNNVQKETQYWDQILSISDEGWNVCRIPGHQHRLGVTYGFSESTRRFRDRGVAELTASSSGNIMLERSIGTRPHAMRAVLRRNENIFGVSKVLPMLDQEETTLEARIRYARDSLFDEELFHEMVRESRSAASLGVGMEGSTIRFDFSEAGEGSRVELELVPLDQDNEVHLENSDERGNEQARAIVLAAKLLLSQAHRDRLKKRSEIPLTLTETKKDDKPVLPILRPIMSCIMHRTALDRLNVYAETTTKLLQAANINCSYKSAGFKLPSEVDIANAETLVTLLMQPWTSEASISFTDPKDRNTAFQFRVDTTLGYGFGSAFTISTGSATGTYRAESIEECIDAANAKLGSALAKALAGTMDDGWKCNEKEAVVFKEATDGEKGQSVRIVVDGDQKTLSLSSPSKRVVWTVEGECSSEVFWDVIGRVE